ncbi:MAG TPA: hypothetical protein VMB80_06785 [Candidatus Acidoferrum sp.]|nr:hypothetical protein [Candidatus Acidoferrum sp.]
MALSLLALLTLVNGCAFGTRHAVLVYPPEPSAAATNAPPPATAGKVALGTFADSRSDKLVLGFVRNGYGSKTAEVQCDTNVVPFITDAVRYELQQAGWEIVDLSTATNSSVPVISGEMLVLHCDAFMSYEGNASLSFSVTRDGREIFKKTYGGEAGGGLNWAMTGKSYGKTVSKAVQDALLSFVRDLPTAIPPEPAAREPGAGK